MRDEITKWDVAVAAFRYAFNGEAKPTKQESKEAKVAMNKAARAWCDRSVRGVRPRSPFAVAGGG